MEVPNLDEQLTCRECGERFPAGEVSGAGVCWRDVGLSFIRRAGRGGKVMFQRERLDARDSVACKECGARVPGRELSVRGSCARCIGRRVVTKSGQHQPGGGRPRKAAVGE
ncbi:MAG: hypothetical protein KGJ86_00550 [Chloroflexota bacterium]|nr:hypothetical protein [Chloroflexota bacterium]